MLPRIFAVLAIFLPSLVFADTSDPKMQMLFLGTSPEQGAPGPVPGDLPSITVDSLPVVNAARQTVFAARLQANPVSTFVAQPNDAHAQFEQFFLVTKVGLASESSVALGGEEFELDDFADRVSALVGAFNPKHRRIALVQVSDPDDLFPMAVGDIQAALNATGFDMMVLMIDGDASASCAASEPLHYSLVSGLPDREPFGNGDGISTAAEVETYLTQALNRQSARDPSCGPRYSVLLKSSNDPAQELVAFKGRSVFNEIEAQLYNETFEAMFLMTSDSRDSVQEFLASCLYCPNERALKNRVRQMEDTARTAALEADIWDRIKGDESPERLAIYLENCDLCTFRNEAAAKMDELEAIALACDAEALAYSVAVDGRDVVALRLYVSDCVACAFQGEARDMVAEIEADEAYQRETAAFAAALEARDIELLSGYLNDCKICEGREAVATALEVETKRVELVHPCLKMASVPQLGGPRHLELIDPSKAQPLCSKAAEAFPQDGDLLTTLGRIALAQGDFDAANAKYEAGMSIGAASAYGLTAYSYYYPPEGQELDLVEAEKLAIIGAEKGDWLSQEILTVLYSKGLVPGRDPGDAFEIAEKIATEGNEMGEFLLGYFYLTGTGTATDTQSAEDWLRKSVDQGYTPAMAYLAEAYEIGPAGEPQPELAADLYWTALKQGDETAATRLTSQLNSRSRDVIRLIQVKLGEEGAYRGGADGIAGAGTVTAIREFVETLGENQG